MITHGNGVIPTTPRDAGRWSIRNQSQVSLAVLPGSPSGGAANEYELELNGNRWLVWEWFWVDGKSLADPRRVKRVRIVQDLRGERRRKAQTAEQPSG